MLTSEVAGTTDRLSMELTTWETGAFVGTAGLAIEGAEIESKACGGVRPGCLFVDASRQSGKFSEIAEQFLRESRKRNMPYSRDRKCESVEGLFHIEVL